MIVDTSAIVAILRDEPEAAAFIEALARTPAPTMSAGTYLEAAIVVDANADPVLSARFDELLTVAGVVVEPVSQAQADAARRAYRDFGKGSGHPAGLNFGDCFAYALARSTGRPLLYKGADFIHTDLVAAVEARQDGPPATA